MTTKDVTGILDGIQAERMPKLREAKTAPERMYWEGYLSALTYAAMLIERAGKTKGGGAA